MLRQTTLLLVALVPLAAACDRRVEPYIPAEQEPPPPERPVRIPGLSSPEARVPALDAAGARRGMAAAPAAASASASGLPIRGQVRLAEGVTAPPDGVLFVIARGPGGGPPLAVKRMTPASFPVSFELGPADVMMQGRPFVGPITLSARLDRDGDPLTRADDDPSYQHVGSLAPGAEGIEIVLR